MNSGKVIVAVSEVLYKTGYLVLLFLLNYKKNKEQQWRLLSVEKKFYHFVHQSDFGKKMQHPSGSLHLLPALGKNMKLL